jgi:glycosyltransferase involved in cell wall biosynthesis
MPKSLHAVRHHIAEVSPDIVHTHLGASDLLGSVAARSLGLPAISTIHTTEWRRDVRTYMTRRLVRLFVTRMVAVSDAARRACLQRGFAGNDQVVTIWNGVAAEAMPGSGRELRRELGWQDDDLVVGMLSALRAVKGHDVAVSAFRQLLDEFPKLKLLIVGRGRERDRIANMTQELGNRVAMIGHRFDVMRCLDAFDVCLHPSRAEALPTTLIEAMAAGVPVLATAVGGVPELVIDGRTGVLVSPPPTRDRLAEALAALLRDHPRRQALASAGRRRYEERFTIGPWIGGIRSLYEDVLRDHQECAGRFADRLTTSPDRSGAG